MNQPRPATEPALRWIVSGLARSAGSAPGWTGGCAILRLPGELREWFHAHPGLWSDFRRLYSKELARPEAEPATCGRSTVSRVTRSASPSCLSPRMKDTIMQSLLKQLLDGMRKPPTGTGPGAIRIIRKRIERCGAARQSLRSNPFSRFPPSLAASVRIEPHESRFSLEPRSACPRARETHADHGNRECHA